MAVKFQIKKILLVTTTISLIFNFLIVTDLIPLIRNYPDPNLSSAWPYYFVNTFNKVWAPSLAMLGILIAFVLKAKGKISKIPYLTLMVILVFIFQISLVYYSRFGINVMFRRVADPGINGYFSASLTDHSIPQLIQEFPEINNTFFQHAPTHPPGAIALVKLSNTFFENNPKVSGYIYSKINKPSGEAERHWNILKPFERVSAIFVAFASHLIAAFSIIPLFFIVRKLFDEKTAAISVLLYSFIPGFSFFAPFFDPLYSLIGLTGFLFAVYGLKNAERYLFLSGVIFGISLLFSLSVIPILVMVFFWVLFEKQLIFRRILYLISGYFTSLILLIALGFNPVSTSLAISAAVAHKAREYLPTLFFNPLDFFTFLSIPITILFVFASLVLVKDKNSKVINITVSFLIVLTLLTISGLTRGEVGRIWLPLMFIPVIISAFLVSRLGMNFRQISLISIHIAIQTILIEEFWVPIW
jgi:hypothetical protein